MAFEHALCFRRQVKESYSLSLRPGFGTHLGPSSTRSLSYHERKGDTFAEIDSIRKSRGTNLSRLPGAYLRYIQRTKFATQRLDKSPRTIILAWLSCERGDT